jgi:hypothetical protein
VFTNQIEQLVKQFEFMLAEMTDEEYARPLAVFNGSSIGQHCRHLVEFFVELEKGYADGIVDYDNRARDPILESNRNAALASLQEIGSKMEKPDRSLQVRVTPPDAQTASLVHSSYFREMSFVLEHAIHHLALMRIGIEQVRDISLPAEFGVAFSTQRYRSSGTK